MKIARRPQSAISQRRARIFALFTSLRRPKIPLTALELSTSPTDIARRPLALVVRSVCVVFAVHTLFVNRQHRTGPCDSERHPALSPPAYLPQAPGNKAPLQIFDPPHSSIEVETCHPSPKSRSITVSTSMARNRRSWSFSGRSTVRLSCSRTERYGNLGNSMGQLLICL